MISFLVKRASPIQLLVSNTAHGYDIDEEVRPSEDTNGHAWPFCAYHKGTVSFETVVSRSVNRVVAVPIGGQDIEMLELFHWFFT